MTKRILKLTLGNGVFLMERTLNLEVGSNCSLVVEEALEELEHKLCVVEQQVNVVPDFVDPAYPLQHYHD
jgi:hypothetical protein